MAHAVRIKTSTNQKSSPSTVPEPSPPSWDAQLVEDRIKQNAFKNLSEVLPDQASKARKTNTEPDGSGTDYIQAVKRADEADTKTDVLDEVENGVTPDAEWYKIEYHDCTHDKGGGPCGDWKTERENGTVPSDI